MVRAAVHKGVGSIAAGLAVVAVAATLSGCELPPICGQFSKDCVELNHPPTVQLSTTHFGVYPHLYSVPIVGQYVWFVAKAEDADGDTLYYEWDLDADGRFETVSDGRTPQDRYPYVERIFSTPGVRRVTVRVTDYPQLGGGEGSATATIDLRIYSEEDAQSNQPPVASFTVSVSGRTVQLDASGSTDPDGDRIDRYRWDFNQDGFDDLDLGEPQATWTFDRDGTYEIRLRVVDARGAPSESVKQTVTVSGPCTPPSCGGAAYGSGTPKTLPFSARLTGKTLRASMLDLPGKASWAERTLRRFLKAALRPRLKARGTTSTGLVVATGRKGSRACLRISYTVEAGKAPTGTLEVVGGTKAAARLRAKATFRFAGAPNGSALGLGTVRATRGKPRPLSRACAKLARVRRG